MSTEIETTKGLQLFYSYSHKDAEVREALEVHLALMRAEGIIREWHDRQILAGGSWDDEIHHALESADIILLLVSADFLASDYCMKREAKRALELHTTKRARVVPIIVRACEWRRATFGELQVLPMGGTPVMSWDNIDDALNSVATEIRRLCTSQRPRRGIRGWSEANYVKRLGQHVCDLQNRRSFVYANGKQAIPLQAMRLRKDGTVNTGLPSVRFRVTARKMSVNDLRKQYGGAELEYDDYLTLMASASKADRVEDVVQYTANVRAGWAIQLLGAPGVGKSFLFREACMLHVEQYGKQQLVPFLIELRDLPDGELCEPSQILDFIAGQVASLLSLQASQIREHIQLIFEQGRAVVFLDAIDELGDPIRTLQTITTFQRQHFGNRYIFSCRTFDQVPGLLAEELVLLPLSAQSLKEYFRAALAEHTCLTQVLSAMRNRSMLRALSTPLVASAFARFVKDRDRLPNTLHEALTDGLQQRFFASGVERNLFDASISEEDLHSMYSPVAGALRAISNAMGARLTGDRRILESIAAKYDAAGATPCLQWARWAGVLYETAEGELAFSLHRYKELYLAEDWANELATTGEWPVGMRHMLGRVLWNDALTLFSEQVDVVQFSDYVAAVGLSLYARLHELDSYARYRFVETVAFCGRIASRIARSTKGNSDDGLASYYHALWWLHYLAVHPTMNPDERMRLVRSLAAHSTQQAADVLIAIFDDAHCTGSALGREVVEDSAITALAELFLVVGLDVHRAQELVARTRNKLLAKSTQELFAETKLGKQIMLARAKVATVVLLSIAAISSVVMYFARLSYYIGHLPIGIALTITVSALLLLHMRLKRLLSRTDSTPLAPSAVVAPAGTWGIPYRPNRYWLSPGIGTINTPVKTSGRRLWEMLLFGLAAGLAFVAALDLLTVATSITSVSMPGWLTAFASLFAPVLKWAFRFIMYILSATMVLGFALGIYGSIAQVYKNRLFNREWRQRLKNVSQESQHLRQQNADISYLVDHLMDGIAATDVAKLQARIEAIRKHLIFDDYTRGKLLSYADATESTAIAKLLWSLIADMDRMRVMHEERRMFQTS